MDCSPKALWLTCSLYRLSTGRFLQGFEVQASSSTELRGELITALGRCYAFDGQPVSVFLDRTPECRTYFGVMRSRHELVTESASVCVSIGFRLVVYRSHRLDDEADPWWGPHEGAADGFTPLDFDYPTAQRKTSRRVHR